MMMMMMMLMPRQNRGVEGSPRSQAEDAAHPLTSTRLQSQEQMHTQTEEVLQEFHLTRKDSEKKIVCK